MAIESPVPGDVVRHEGSDRVVVDVTDDGLAVLRRPGDLELLEPTVAEVSSLEVVGHVGFVDGWVELEHGVWELT
jgi:hypothetical protein